MFIYKVIVLYYLAKRFILAFDLTNGGLMNTLGAAFVFNLFVVSAGGGVIVLTRHKFRIDSI
jgi:hypothetical protein